MDGEPNEMTVYQYLKKRGFKVTEQSFLNELTHSNDTASGSLDQFIFDASLLDTASPLHSAGPPDASFNVFMTETPQSVVESYQALQNYIEDSLDLYKSELQAVLFPFYVHLFLDLMVRGFSQEAVAFRDQHAQDFADQFPDDVQQLQSITDSAHVKQHPLAMLYRQNKYIVLMSSYAFELLLSFLMDSHYVTLLKLLNQYLNIKVYSTKPLHKTNKEESMTVGITGHTSQHIRSVNQQKVLTGKREPDSPFQELVERRVKQDPELSADGNDAYKTFKEASYSEDAPSKDEGIPLPPTTNQDVVKEIEAIKDLRNRVKLSSKYLPSVVTYTLHNTVNTYYLHEMVAGGFSDSYIKIWSITGNRLRSLKGTTEYAAHDFETMDDPNAGREHPGDICKKLVGHSGPVYDLSFSPDDKYLISASQDGTARLWSTDTFTNLVAYKGHNYPIWSTDFGPYGHYFATGSHDRTARLWSLERPYPLRVFSGHLSDVECVKFHPNSNYLVTSSTDKTIRLWDVHRGKCVRLFTTSALASATSDLSGPGLGEGASTSKVERGHPTYTKSILSLSVSPDGAWCASGADDGSVVVWELGSGRVLRRFGPPAFGGRGDSSAIDRVGSPVFSLSFSGDSGSLCAGYADGYVRVWDLKRGQSEDALRSDTDPHLLCAVKTKRTPIHDVTFSPRNLILSLGPFLPL